MIKQCNLLLILFFLILIISGCQNSTEFETLQFKEIKRPYETISPFVSNLLKLDNHALKSEVEKNWLSAKRNGFPLIEADSLDTEYKYLTFMFQDSTENKEIFVDVFGIYDETRLGDQKLRRMANTDLYYRCYKVPVDICLSYRFHIKDTITGEEYKITDKYNLDRIPYGEIRSFSYSVFDLRKNEPNWNIKKYNNLNSTIDTISYKDKVVNKERNIYVYLPPDYDKTRKEPYPVIFLFDAFIYLNRVEVPNILDNLISEGKIEPMIAVLFGTYRSSRDIILPLNFPFKDEFISEFLPMIRKNYNMCLKPDNNIIGGMSYGGLAAAFIGFYHPEIFGKILSQSGSFWRGIELTDKHGKWIRQDWIIEKFITADRKELKLFLDWGLQENFVLGSNRRMIKTLDDKEYNFKFNEFNGWHDWANSRKTFPEGLMYLLE